MATISERLRCAMDARGLKQSDLVRITGIGKSSVCTYLTGEYEPKQKNIYKLAHALNVSEAWLMGCDVPMEPVVTSIQFPPKIQKLVDLAEELNEEGQERLLDYADDLASSGKYKKYNPDSVGKKEA